MTYATTTALQEQAGPARQMPGRLTSVAGRMDSALTLLERDMAKQTTHSISLRSFSHGGAGSPDYFRMRLARPACAGRTRFERHPRCTLDRRHGVQHHVSAQRDAPSTPYSPDWSLDISF